MLRLFAVFAVCSICATAQVKSMALNQTRYEIQAGSPVPLSASSDTVDFVLKAAELNVVPSIGLVVGPNRAGNQVVLAASARAKPGEYTVTLSATGPTGEQRQAAMDVVVKPRVTVPSNATRAPVVLLNGWETLYTNACPVSTDSTETFGNLAQYLTSDGVPVVYFFDNCTEDPNQPVEKLAQDLATFLGTIKYDNGVQVPQIDLVAFSLGGLVARAYLAGLQPDETLAPPATTLIRDLVLIAVPNYGSYLAGNYASSIIAGTQSAELIPASAFLWNLATWNQHGDDLRGVNAIAVIGNAGSYVNNLTAASLANASDGLVSITSASLGFVAQNPAVTQIVPYCQVDASAFTNANIAYECTASGIANVTDESQFTGEIVRSFLAGTSTWQSVGTTPATDLYLSVDGGAFFALLNSTGSYVTDLTQVIWGTLTLIGGEDAGTIFYNDFVAGTGMYEATSASLGTIDCNAVTEVVGYAAPERCKLATTIVSVGPLENSAARQVAAGSAITINGEDFGDLCNGCKVTANGQSLSVSSWSETSITAQLPTSLSGLVTIEVLAAELGSSDAINIMVGSGVPAITGVTNAGSFQAGFAPATWVSIFGTDLASTTYTWQPSDFTDGKLPTSLQGVSVMINGNPAYVEYISPTQINVLVPDNTTVGSVTVQVTANQVVSNSMTAQQQQFSPSFFTVGGSTVAAVHANGTLVSTSSPAAPGEEIVLYGTGFGPTNPATSTGQLVTTSAALANTVQFTIGGVTLAPSSVEFAGLVEAGLYQFNVTVPASLKSGDAAVVATIGGVNTQSGVSIPVN
jgi:uncharacterized protein (TIGR03437 family)